MGYLIEKTKLKLLLNGNGLVENFHNNSLELAEMYQKSSKDVLSIPIKNITPGGFYHLISVNESNWMRYAPVFIVEFKKISNKIIFIAVNLNFIPLEIRVLFFDKFIIEKDFEKDTLLKVKYTGIYNELRSIGFEYSLMEFDASKILFAHKISMDMVPRFLISAHPTNKYDPKKLMEIWNVKISKNKERDEEMKKLSLEDIYNVNTEINNKYDVLKNHIMRVRRNL